MDHFERTKVRPRRGEAHDCMDAGGRAKQEARAEEARNNKRKFIFYGLYTH